MPERGGGPFFPLPGRMPGTAGGTPTLPERPPRRAGLLEAGLADTAKNPSGVAPLSVSSGDFATQAIIEKVNELIASLQRS